MWGWMEWIYQLYKGASCTIYAIRELSLPSGSFLLKPTEDLQPLSNNSLSLPELEPAKTNPSTEQTTV